MKQAFYISCFLFIALSCNTTSSQNSNDPLFKWVEQNSQKIKTLSHSEDHSDITSLKQIVNNAEVVCLGENRHDIHEQFQLKHKFIKYLVEEMGFTTLVLEASLPYSYRINDYVLNGTGNLDEIMASMPGWFLWDTEEIKDVFNWVKAYNQHQENNKVKFYGIDIVAPNDALDQLFEYLHKVDKPFWEEIQQSYFARDIIDDNYWPNTRQRYAELTVEQKQSLVENHNRLTEQIQENKVDYIALSSLEEYDWISILACAVHEMNRMFSSEDQLEAGLIRDNAMAEIALWIKERNEKMIIWAHNVHICKSPFTMTMMPGVEINGMGYLLHQELKDKMVSIGASFNIGEFQGENRTFEPADPNSIDGVLANPDIPYFLLNLDAKAENPEVEKWLKTNNSMRGQEFEMTIVPCVAFDAIFFTDNISKVRYNPSTLERLKN